MSDPIRAALDKAVAIDQAPTRHIAPEKHVAEIIAAFLRALPDLSVCPRLACNYNGSGDSSATLADAVLAAAKEASNDS
jgi:hypothetical protein